jgi:single-strand DNA-binding protein
MNLNKAFVLGNLTKDPDIRSLPSGQNVASFSIATNRVWNDKAGARQEDVQFHNIVVFGRMADTCAKYLSKGKMVLIEGRIQTRSWDAQDGTKKYRTEIVAETMQLGPRLAGQSEGGPSLTANRAPGQKPVAKEKNEIPVIEQTEEIDVSDIPF